MARKRRRKKSWGGMPRNPTATQHEARNLGVVYAHGRECQLCRLTMPKPRKLKKDRNQLSFDMIKREFGVVKPLVFESVLLGHRKGMSKILRKAVSEAMESL